MKNYYKILGVMQSATADEIKSAYRKLAKMYHPDFNPNNEMAMSKFKDVSEAYDTLCDVLTRAEYDKKFLSAMESNASANTYANGARQAYDQTYAMATEAQKQGYNMGYTKGFTDAEKKYTEQLAVASRNLEELKQRVIASEGRAVSLSERIAERDSIISALEEALDSQPIVTKTQEPPKEQPKEPPKEPIQEKTNKDKLLASMQAKIDSIQTQNERKVELLMAQIAEHKQDSQTLVKEINVLHERIEALEDDLAQWEEYSTTQAQSQDNEKIEYEWNLKIKADKAKAKKTSYGDLGLLFWSTDEEIKASYEKLVKRYKKKAEQGDEKAKQKLYEVNNAFRHISSPELRRTYNATFSVTEDEIAKDRLRYADYLRALDELKKAQGEQEFQAYLKELMYNADVGDADAQNSLGELYYYGDELAKDLVQAVYWFKEAAKQKHPDALFNLGICFLSGEGVEKDVFKGNGFIKQAEKLGSNSASVYLLDKKLSDTAT